MVMDLLSLPDEVLIHILAWLPAKLVCQLKCMNKSLLKASSNPYFVSYQSRCTTISNSGFFLQDSLGWSLLQSSAQLLYFDPASCGIPKESAQKLAGCKGKIAASKRGLVIINKSTEEEDLLYLLNPILLPHTPPLRLPSLPNSNSNRCQWFERSLPPNSIRCQVLQRHLGQLSMAISFEDATDHYIIICLMTCTITYNHDSDRDKREIDFVDCMLYDSRVERWRDKPMRISYNCLSRNLHNLVICNGMIHHLVTDRNPRLGIESPDFRVYKIALVKIHMGEEKEEEKAECYPIPAVPGEGWGNMIQIAQLQDGIEITPWGHNSLCLVRCKANSTFIGFLG